MKVQKPYAVRLRAALDKPWGEWIPLTTKQYEKITSEWSVPLPVVVEVQLLLDDGVSVVSPVSQYAQYCLLTAQQKELF